MRVGGAGEIVTPLVERLEERVRGAYIVRTDATGLRVLDPSSPGNVQRGSFWAVVGDDRDVLFRYTPTGEGATGPWEFLAGRKGYIQADAANVFDRLFNGQAASAVEIGCWAHGRRRLVALQDTDCRVAYPLKLIARLYRIEHLADAQGLSPEERTELRKARASPILERLKRWFVATAASEPPSSDLAKAAAYCLNHWTALTRFVEDGRGRALQPDPDLRPVRRPAPALLHRRAHQARGRLASRPHGRASAPRLDGTRAAQLLPDPHTGVIDARSRPHRSRHSRHPLLIEVVTAVLPRPHPRGGPGIEKMTGGCRTRGPSFVV